MATKKNKKNRLLRNNEYYDLQMTFDNLYERSKKNKTFRNLYGLIISKNNVLLAYRNIKKNKGSTTSGTNKSTIMDIAEENISEITKYVENRLRHFKPHKVKRVEIPKANGKTRPLGIPTIEDRLIQQCIKQVIEPICEAKFHKHSYGFRPNRSTHHAIARSMVLMQASGFRYAVDIDIKGFFDNVNHGKLLKQLWHIGIQDKKVLKIISCLLKAEIENVGIPVKGTPQGGIISPLLSNVVLNELDWWVSDQWETFETKYQYSQNSSKYDWLRKRSELKEMFIVRYADDFKILCKSHKVAWKILHATKKWLKERLNLEISNEKSKVINLHRNYSEFLGFKLKLRDKRKKKVCKTHISDKSKKRMIKEIKLKIAKIKKYPSIVNVNKYNATILGMHNYYSKATHCNVDFSEISFLVFRYLHNQLRNIRGSTGLKSKAFSKYYKKYNYEIVYVSKVALFPIPAIKNSKPMGFSQEICNYTAEGRDKIHKGIKGISSKTIKYLLDHTIISESIEYNDNRISLYVGQNGKCGVTNESLDIGNMECHHIKPRKSGGTDEYKNLMIVKYKIHKVIHATKKDTINNYLKELNLNKKQLEKVNKLRVEVGNEKVA